MQHEFVNSLFNRELTGSQCSSLSKSVEDWSRPQDISKVSLARSEKKGVGIVKTGKDQSSNEDIYISNCHALFTYH